MHSVFARLMATLSLRLSKRKSNDAEEDELDANVSEKRQMTKAASEPGGDVSLSNVGATRRTLKPLHGINRDLVHVSVTDGKVGHGLGEALFVVVVGAH